MSGFENETYLLALHLRQYGFGLGEPEGHVHGPVEDNGGGQGGAGLLALAGGSVQGAETQVAVRLQRTHAEFLGQCQGLLVAGCSLCEIRGIGVGIDDTKLVQRQCLIPMFLVLPGQRESLTGVLAGLSVPSRQTTDLAEARDPGDIPCKPACADTFADRLLQQRASLNEASLERRSIPQVCRNR
jgi:hypothetical protein